MSNNRSHKFLLSEAVTIRIADPTDAEALRRLAQRDSARAIDGPAFVAETGGELRAAISVQTGAAIADPFQPTAELVDLLRLHAAQRQLEPRTTGAGTQSSMGLIAQAESA